MIQIQLKKKKRVLLEELYVRELLLICGIFGHFFNINFGVPSMENVVEAILGG